MEHLWGSVQSAGRWCYRHRAGIAGAAAVGAGVYVAFRFAQEFAQQRREQLPALEVRRQKRRVALVQAQREFSFLVINFLPNLQAKINEKVDVSKSIRALKQVKSSGQDADKQQIQQLWKEILVSTFTLVMSACAMFCTMVALLKVQVHLLAREWPTSPLSSGDEHNGGTTTPQQRLALYHRLMSQTYKPLLTTGLDAAVQIVRKAVETALDGWSVETKPQVDFEELRLLFKQMQFQLHEQARQQANVGASGSAGASSCAFAQHVIAPCRDAQRSSSPVGVCESKSGDVQSAADEAQDNVQSIIWDVVESDLFSSAFDEALDKVLERVLMHLRLTAYGPSNAQATLPALATLLPQLRPIPTKLCSTERENLYLYEASNVEPLNVLCEALYDADMG